MKRLKVRWRLTLWYGTVLTAVVAGFGATVFLMMQHKLDARTDFELDEEIGELVLEVSLARDAEDLKQQLQHRFFRHASFDFQVSHPDGEPVFCSERLVASALTVPSLDGLTNSLLESRNLPGLGTCRVVSRTAAGPAGTFVVQCLSPLTGNAADLNALLMVLLTAGPLAIAGALGGGYLLAREALAPVEKMRTTAEQITADSLDQRLEVLNPDDELGRLGGTLNRMIDRLQRSLDDMRRFTADAAHELRTPLAILRTEAEVALRFPKAGVDYRTVVETALEETDRLTRLADQLLVLSRQEAGIDRSAREEVRIDALLLDVVEKARGPAERKAVEIEVRSVDPAVVTGNDIDLSRLFSNLLNNALKYVPEGGLIRVACESKDPRVSITFEDNGAGIAGEHLPHLFKRFYRVDPSRSSESGGAGLGLAICKAIVESHGGQISVESAIGCGTTFTVLLPQQVSALSDGSPALVG